jgi:hypothetical protein
METLCFPKDTKTKKLHNKNTIQWEDNEVKKVKVELSP